jgi:hypothetical protein
LRRAVQMHGTVPMKFSGALKENLGVVGTFILSLGGLFGMVLGFNSYLDNRIESRLTDPVFVKQLNSKLRPTVIFDEHGTILSDSGGMEHIREIRVVRSDKDKNDWIVTIRSIRHLAVEPVIEPLDDRYVVNAHRGQGFDWIFTLDAKVFMVAQSSATIDHPERFRLELVP